MQVIIEALSSNIVRVILVGTILLGVVSGILGVFTLLKKQALIGDALSHATLPGVVLMFITTQTRSISVLLIGAAISAALAMWLMNVIKKYSKIQSDAVLALILSSFFGFGRFLISLIARSPDFSKINFDNFIFGNAATMLISDVITILIVLIIILMIITIAWRHLKLQIFNDEFYRAIGFKSVIIDFLTTFMTILVIVLGIRMVGVILMSSLLIVPGVASRQWSNKLHINVILSGILGGLAALIGTLYSVTYDGNMPTGPAIVVVGTTIAILSILVAPKRGILAKEFRRQIQRFNIIKYKDLIHLYENNGLISDKNANYDNYLQLGLVNYTDNKYLITDLGIKKVETIIGGKIHGRN